MVQDEFREGRPKSVVVSETIDSVHQLILQDRHVTYREIETTLDISGSSIHSIVHEHLTVKKFLCFGSHTLCQSLKQINKSEWQKGYDNWFKRMHKCMDHNGEYFEKHVFVL